MTIGMIIPIMATKRVSIINMWQTCCDSLNQDVNTRLYTNIFTLMYLVFLVPRNMGATGVELQPVVGFPDVPLIVITSNRIDKTEICIDVLFKRAPKDRLGICQAQNRGTAYNNVANKSYTRNSAIDAKHSLPLLLAVNVGGV